MPSIHNVGDYFRPLADAPGGIPPTYEEVAKLLADHNVQIPVAAQLEFHEFDGAIHAAFLRGRNPNARDDEPSWMQLMILTETSHYHLDMMCALEARLNKNSPDTLWED